MRPEILPRRKLRRNDVVMERHGESFSFFGRVWYRIDDHHVVVICCGRYITVYHEDELDRINYKGCGINIYQNTEERKAIVIEIGAGGEFRNPGLLRVKELLFL